MIRTARSILAFAAPMLLTSMTALAQGHGEHGEPTAPKAGVLPEPNQGAIPFLVTLGVFAVVFIILSVKVWPQISRGLKDRENKIRSEIEAAEKAQQQARAALAEYERNLAQARAEAQKMLDDAKTQQQVIAAELKAKADAELTDMRERAKREIEAARTQAVLDIHTQATGLATLMATKILKREVSQQDQQRLVQESLSELQTAGR